MTVGDRLRQIRGQKTLQEFSEPLNVGSANISHIENGRSKLSTDLAIRIAQEYEVSIDWLLMGVGTMKRVENINLPQESSTNLVTITKDELLKLQRMALDKTEKELDEKNRQVERLKNAD